MASLYTVNNVAATPSGIPISKYYPNLSSDNVIFNGEVELNCDLGPYLKGTKITGENFTDLINAILGSVDGNSSRVKELEETITRQQDTIDRLKNIIEQGGTGTGLGSWPDISNIDGGNSDDPGDNGGTDDVRLVTV